LCEWTAPRVATGRRISLEKKLLATLWLLSTPDSYRSVADRFDLYKGTLHDVVKEVCNALVALKDEFCCYFFFFF
jgi:hypothetical protein